MWGWLWNIISRKAVEPITNKPPVMPVTEPTIVKKHLADAQYYQTVHIKKYIFTHHTAGGSAESSMAHWASNSDHIATAYVIDRDGTIFEAFDPKHWAYHLGVKGNSALEKASIGIEICSYGALTEKDGKWLTYTGKAILPENTVQLEKPFRGFQIWEAYTEAQIESLKQLLPYLIDRFNIPLQEDRNNFWEYQDPNKLPPGIWSHSTVRKDKIDIFPQPSLIEVVNSL